MNSIKIVEDFSKNPLQKFVIYAIMIAINDEA